MQKTSLNWDVISWFHFRLVLASLTPEPVGRRSGWAEAPGSTSGKQAKGAKCLCANEMPARAQRAAAQGLPDFL